VGDREHLAARIQADRTCIGEKAIDLLLDILGIAPIALAGQRFRPADEDAKSPHHHLLISWPYEAKGVHSGIVRGGAAVSNGRRVARRKYN
jgi:hypothetical protein